MFGPGMFGDMFDLNNDGKMDLFEEACEVEFFNKLMKESEEAEKKNDPWYHDNDTDRDDE